MIVPKINLMFVILAVVVFVMMTFKQAYSASNYTLYYVISNILMQTILVI